MTINRKSFHLCLDHAIEVIELFQAGGQPHDETFHVIEISVVIDAIKLHDDTLKISDKTRGEIVKAMAEIFTFTGFTSCAVWPLAHELEHILYPA